MDEPGRRPPTVVDVPLPATITVRVTQPAANDEWGLDHPYVLDRIDDPSLHAFLANLTDIAHICRNGETTRETAWMLNLSPDQLIAGIEQAAVERYVTLTRTPSQVTITTTGATPSLAGDLDRDDPLRSRDQHYDPHGLRNLLPDIDQRPPSYTMFHIPALPGQHWAIDSRYSRGTWGHYLGPNANRLLGIVAGELRDPDGELAIRPTAAAMHITPRRLHAELDDLHRHGLIDIEHHHSAIAASGYVADPSPDVMRANPAIAISHRCLIRHGRTPAPAPGLGHDR